MQIACIGNVFRARIPPVQKARRDGKNLSGDFCNIGALGAVQSEQNVSGTHRVVMHNGLFKVIRNRKRQAAVIEQQTGVNIADVRKFDRVRIFVLLGKQRDSRNQSVCDFVVIVTACVVESADNAFAVAGIGDESFEIRFADSAAETEEFVTEVADSPDQIFRNISFAVAKYSVPVLRRSLYVAVRYVAFIRKEDHFITKFTHEVLPEMKGDLHAARGMTNPLRVDGAASRCVEFALRRGRRKCRGLYFYRKGRTGVLKTESSISNDLSNIFDKKSKRRFLSILLNLIKCI